MYSECIVNKQVQLKDERPMFNNEYIAKKMFEDRQRELRGNNRNNTIVEVVTEYAEEHREERRNERREHRG